jgi:hypothetical protein
MAACAHSPVSCLLSFSLAPPAARERPPPFQPWLWRIRPRHRRPHLRHCRHRQRPPTARSRACARSPPTRHARRTPNAIPCRSGPAPAAAPRDMCRGRRPRRRATHCAHWASATRPSAARRTPRPAASAPAGSRRIPARCAVRGPASWARPASRSSKARLSRISPVCCRAVILLCQSKGSAARHATVMDRHITLEQAEWCRFSGVARVSRCWNCWS